jgi:hypothetical protein
MEEESNLSVFYIEFENELTDDEYDRFIINYIKSEGIYMIYPLFNLYLQKLLFGKIVNKNMILLSNESTYGIFDSTNFYFENIRGKIKYDKIQYRDTVKFRYVITNDLQFPNMKIIRCEFDMMIILLCDERDDLVIRKVIVIGDENIEIPTDKYFLEYFRGRNMLCIIVNDNIKDNNLKDHLIFTRESENPEYVKKVSSKKNWIDIEIIDGNNKKLDRLNIMHVYHV